MDKFRTKIKPNRFLKPDGLGKIIYLLCLMVWSIILTACTPLSVPPDSGGGKPTVNLDKVMSSPDYGMHVFLYWREEVADRDLKAVQETGFRWIKQEFPWREMEPKTKGGWEWTNADRMVAQIEAHNLKVIARLGTQPAWASDVKLPEVSPPRNLQDFYDYVFAVAQRYKGQIEAYQIWNEPNLAREWGGKPPNPAEYVALLKVGYLAVKAADPDAVVISAGLAPTTRHDGQAMPDTYFIQGIYDAGGAPYFESLGVNAAGFKSPPDLDPTVVANDPVLTNGDTAPLELRRIYCFRHVEDVRALMVRNGDAAKKIIILEFGWTIELRQESPYFWHAVRPEEQAQYFKEAYQYATQHWQPWIGVMSLIYVANPDWTANNEETYWSITYPHYPGLVATESYYNLLHITKVPPVGGK